MDRHLACPLLTTTTLTLHGTDLTLILPIVIGAIKSDIRYKNTVFDTQYSMTVLKWLFVLLCICVFVLYQGCISSIKHISGVGGWGEPVLYNFWVGGYDILVYNVIWGGRVVQKLPFLRYIICARPLSRKCGH